MSCARAEVNMEICEGATFSRHFIWKAGTPAAGVDLSDFVGVAQIRRALTSAVPLFELTQDNEGFVFADQEETPGGYSLHLTAEQTQGLCSGGVPVTLVYDLTFTDADDNVRVLQYGTLTIYPAITRVWEGEEEE